MEDEKRAKTIRRRKKSTKVEDRNCTKKRDKEKEKKREGREAKEYKERL